MKLLNKICVKLTSLAGQARKKDARQFRTLRHEQMEARSLMAADLLSATSTGRERQFDGAWFERISDSAANTANLATETVQWKGEAVEAAHQQWVVQFTKQSGIFTAGEASEYFNRYAPSIKVVGGLGQSGQALVQAVGMSFNGAAQVMQAIPALEYFEPNLIGTAQGTPNDPAFSQLYGLRNRADQDIDADQAWDLTVGKKNMVAAVVDSGVDYNHPDLAANMWRNSGETPGDRIDNDGNGFIDDVHGFDFYSWDGDPMDAHGHGTHVAGTLGAVGNNARGVTGVAWNTSIMAIRILGADNYATSTANIIAAVNYVTMMRVDYGVNVRVANHSWGGYGRSQALQDAIVRSGEADILLVASAMNNNLSNDVLPAYPASYDATNIISVASVNSAGRYAATSNYGAKSVDVAAPGVDIYSTLPGGSYGYFSGTSMAAPHVSGIALLAASINPELGVNGLKQIILSTVDPLADQSKLTVTRGRVNAHKAVIQARATVGQADHFGVWRPEGGLFFADTGPQGNSGERFVQFGLPGDIPVAGDWDGDGRDTIGVFRPNGGMFFLDVNKPGYSGEGAFQFGLPGDWPIAGDWNGDGIDEVGIYRQSSGHFFLDTGARGYNGEQPFSFGLPGDLPIAGDWDGNGTDDVGIFRPGGRSFYLDSGPRGYNGEVPFHFSGPGNLPFAGDWDRDGRDNVGMYNSSGGWAVLDVGQPGYNGETYFQFGRAGDYPVSGNWNSDVKVSVATRPSFGALGMAAGASVTAPGHNLPTIAPEDDIQNLQAIKHISNDAHRRTDGSSHDIVLQRISRVLLEPKVKICKATPTSTPHDLAMLMVGTEWEGFWVANQLH